MRAGLVVQQMNTQCVNTCGPGAYKSNNIVLNPPENSRGYSSLLNGHESSMLNNNIGAAAWCAQTNTAGQYVEIDAGTLMFISGVVAQGRGLQSTHQFIKTFIVEYRVENSDVGTCIEKFTSASTACLQPLCLPDTYASLSRLSIITSACVPD